MKKKFTGIIVCLLMVCMSLLAGCSLVETDPNKYYNSIVVELKNDEGQVVSQITSRELINGYSSIGYYYEYQGMTRAEAVAETITLLENRRVIVLQAEAKYGVDKTGKGLTEDEKTYLWEQTVASLQSNLDYYYDQLVDTTTSTETESSTDSATFTGYTKNAYYDIVDGQFVIKKTNIATGVLDGYVPSVSPKDFNDKEDKALIYENFIEENKLGKRFEAREDYLAYLLSAESKLGLSEDEKSVFEREIENLYNEVYENYLVERYSQDLLAGSDVSYIGVQDILDLYSQKVRTDYAKYVIEQDSTYDSTVQSSYSGVYYYKPSVQDTQYFTVANVLFNKSTTESGKYDLIIRQDEDGDGVYEAKSTEAKTKSEIEAFIASNITTLLTNAQNTKDENIVSDLIKDCVFQYGQDPGMLSADANYLIGVDKEGKAVSNFVEEFNNAGLELYKQNKFGNVYITESEFGIHVLIYTGKCENLFEVGGERFSLKDAGYVEGEVSAFETLANTRISPMLDKTYFDVLYDELYEDKSDMIEQADLEVARAKYTITQFKSNIPSVLR